MSFITKIGLADIERVEKLERKIEVLEDAINRLIKEVNRIDQNTNVSEIELKNRIKSLEDLFKPIKESETLIDIFDKEFHDTTSAQRRNFIRMLHTNEIVNIHDLSLIPYEDLVNLNYCGDKNLNFIKLIYERYILEDDKCQME